MIRSSIYSSTRRFVLQQVKYRGVGRNLEKEFKLTQGIRIE